MARGISTHIGLNSVDPTHYGGWSGPLQACEADAEDLAALAKRASFETTTILTPNATRAAVEGAMAAAAVELVAGDIYFITYSGHGAQLPDLDGDELGNDETDTEDETWCLFDGEMIDDELNKLYGDFDKGVRVLVLSDSCHSGSVTRGVRGASLPNTFLDSNEDDQGTTYRYMPPRIARNVYRANRAFYDSIMQALEDAFSSNDEPADLESRVKATVRLISGCQDEQLSRDGTFNGLFTGKLLAVWNGGRFDGDYAAFHEAIVALMPPDQTPNLYVIGAPNESFAGQKPFTI
ncbi:MAG: caspase family protein [Actinomycetia bacterium]|nr:caspase family protein [Actinomycetes bacterium]